MATRLMEFNNSWLGVSILKGSVLLWGASLKMLATWRWGIICWPCRVPLKLQTPLKRNLWAVCSPRNSVIHKVLGIATYTTCTADSVCRVYGATMHGWVSVVGKRGLDSFGTGECFWSSQTCTMMTCNAGVEGEAEAPHQSSLKSAGTAVIMQTQPQPMGSEHWSPWIVFVGSQLQQWWWQHSSKNSLGWFYLTSHSPHHTLLLNKMDGVHLKPR